MLDQASFDDRRGRYPDVIRARAPRGLRDQLKQVADEEGVSVGELVRQALMTRLESRQGGATPGDGSFSDMPATTRTAFRNALMALIARDVPTNAERAPRTFSGHFSGYLNTEAA